MGILTQDILVTCILMGLIGIVGLVGNALMLRALLKYKNLRTDFYIVFGCLSVADSCFLLLSVPVHIMDMLQATDILSDFWCKSSFYIMNVCSFISAFLVVVLTILRSILLTNRNTIAHPPARYLFIISAAIYIIAFIASIPFIFMYSYFTYKDDSGADHSYCKINDEDIVQEAWLVSSFSAFIPILLATVIYFITYIISLRYFSDSYSRREIEKSRLVSSIFVAFLICQLPYRITVIYDSYLVDFEETARMYTVKNYLLCIVMADRAIKPVLYSKFASDLADAFDEVINCTYCSRPYNVVPKKLARLASYSEPQPSERTQSTSSSNSATSQTVLLNKPNDNFEVDIC
ncbi:allatostatin-A receptor [Biomphalaria pfeifferi]|uniref:Allatostatin-A receptor n=1 Tax=Biomphalaria pfeifferi TaxID=112525 RepID=A0AAD8CCR4_BIOPF|nr:allatostatin-A receptor [Biomphalaria pfeifferi]